MRSSCSIPLFFLILTTSAFCITSARCSSHWILESLDYFPTHRVGTAVILIGKDGGIAHRSGELDLPYLCDLIDSMPMRQQEMRSND